MCKSPGIGSTLDEHNQQARLRKLNQEFRKLVPASEAELMDQVTTLEQRVEELERQLKQAQEDKLKIQIDTLTDPAIYPSMKAECIGEFTVSTQQVCPECWNRDEDNDEYCEFCDDQSDEYSLVDVKVNVPWTTQKEIFKMMCKYKAIALEQESNKEK